MTEKEELEMYTLMCIKEKIEALENFVDKIEFGRKENTSTLDLIGKGVHISLEINHETVYNSFLNA